MCHSKQYFDAALCVGINRYDTTKYKKVTPLRGCEKDAQNMRVLAQKIGYTAPVLMVSEQATFDNFKKAIIQYKEAADKAGKALQLLYTHSSHGTYDIFIRGDQLRRVTGLLFYDRIVWDYDMKIFLRTVLEKDDVVYWVTDACFSEGNLDFRMLASSVENQPDAIPKYYHSLKSSVSEYSKAEAEKLPFDSSLPCNVISLWSCTEQEVSYDLSDGGYFTTKLLEAVLSKPSAIENNNYQTFLQIASLMLNGGLDQHPKFGYWRGSNVQTNTGKKGLSYCKLFTTL